MFSYSLCMIVKNEERVLARCLDSFALLFDEIVIVDTGSDDHTKEIAARYTDRLYDFEWVEDFAAARNFAFSRCRGDYIYSCDADEVLDEENQVRMKQLMEAMLDEVEIVQMKYVDPVSTVLNTKKEWRPKLFKRLRSFRWEDPVHEGVRLAPVVFDSDVEILHLPEGSGHAKRDFSIFQKAYERGEALSANFYKMFATELFKCGDEEDFGRAIPMLEERARTQGIDADALLAAESALCRGCRLTGQSSSFFKHVLKVMLSGVPVSSEICCELGHFFLQQEDAEEAERWYMAAMEEAVPAVDARCAGELPMRGMAACEERLGNKAASKDWERRAAQWELPEE